MTEQEMVEMAEERRKRLREFIDELGTRMGAEGYIDDVSIVDIIAKSHGFFLSTSRTAVATTDAPFYRLSRELADLNWGYVYSKEDTQT